MQISEWKNLVEKVSGNFTGFLFHKIGRVDIEASKCNVTLNAWLLYKVNICGSGG